MDKVRRAYIAGIVDGEGTVTLMKHHKNKTPIPHVAVANNNSKLLNWLKASFGGTMVHKRKNKPHHHDSYV